MLWVLIRSAAENIHNICFEDKKNTLNFWLEKKKKKKMKNISSGDFDRLLPGKSLNISRYLPII